MEQKRIFRDVNNQMIAGVCWGIGEYLNVDPTVIRILFVVAFFLSACIPVGLIYLALWAIVPVKPTP